MRDDQPDDRIRRLFRCQDGVATVAQAKEAGFSAAMIRARVRRGEWLRAAAGVLRVADRDLTPRARTRIAVLSLGTDAVLYGRSALLWWRLTEESPREVEVAVPRGCHPRPRQGVRVVHRDVPASDRTRVDGLVVQHKAPAVLAALAVLGLVAGAHLLDRVLQRGAVGLDGLRRAHARGSGRYGAALASTLLALAGGGARSEAERLAHRSLRAAGITGWEADLGVRLPGYGSAVLDLAFTRQRVLVEIDGWAYHRDLRTFLRDTTRQNALVLEGWTVIRTTWFEMTQDPDQFIANVRTALAS